MEKENHNQGNNLFFKVSFLYLLLISIPQPNCHAAQKETYLNDWYAQSEQKYISTWSWDIDESTEWSSATLTNDKALEMFKYFWTSHNQRKSGRTTYDDRLGVEHIRIRYPRPDNNAQIQYKIRREKFNEWFVEFDKSRIFNEREQKDMEKLEALVNVGLLLKSESSFAKNNINMPSYKYTISDLGWKYLRHNGPPFEFYYGAPTIIKLDGFGPTLINEQVGVEVYYVSVQIGIPSNDELEQWAQDTQVQATYPEILKKLKPITITKYFVRGAKGWTDLDKLISGRRPDQKPFKIKEFKNLSNLEKKKFKENVKALKKARETKELSLEEAKKRIFERTVSQLLKINPSDFTNSFIDLTEFHDKHGLQQFRFRLRGTSLTDPKKQYLCHGNSGYGYNTCYWDEPPKSK